MYGGFPLKRLFSLLMVLMLAAVLSLSVFATSDDTTGGSDVVTTTSDGVYVTGYTVTTPAGGEITTLNVGDQVNIVLQVVDHSSARYAVKAEDIVARINSSIFTYTGTGEIGQLFESNDDPDTNWTQKINDINADSSKDDNQKKSAIATIKSNHDSYNYYSYVLLCLDRYDGNDHKPHQMHVRQ